MKIITIGRSEDCSIRLKNANASRSHAIIIIPPFGKMKIVDLSYNGTSVSGVHLHPNIPTPIKRNQKVVFAGGETLDWYQVPDSKQNWIIGFLVALILILLSIIVLLITCKNDKARGTVSTPVDTIKIENNTLKEQVQLLNDSINNLNEKKSSTVPKEQTKKDYNDKVLNSPLVDKINAQEAAKEKQKESNKKNVDVEKQKTPEKSDKETNKNNVIESKIVVPQKINSVAEVRSLLNAMLNELKQYVEKNNGSAKILQDSETYHLLRSKICNSLIEIASKVKDVEKRERMNSAALQVRQRRYTLALEKLKIL